MAINDEAFDDVVDDVLSGSPQEDKRQVQRPVSSAIVVTTPFVGPKSIHRTIGPVTAVACIAAGPIGDAKVAFRDSWGGRSGEIEKILASLQTHLIQRLSVRAAALGANAVIGTQMSFGEVGTNVFTATAFGTAVVTT